MILTGMTDITNGITAQKQVEFSLDFEQPLITQASATAALNTLMGKLSGGQQVTSSDWSGQTGALPNSNGLSGDVQTYAYGTQSSGNPNFQ
jgi:predicted porin